MGDVFAGVYAYTPGLWKVDTILADPGLTRWFIKFEKETEFSGENLAFLVKVQEYRANPTVEGAQGLYDRFIRMGAPSQINIAGEVREELRGWIRPESSGDPLDNFLPPKPPPEPEDVFNKAAKEIRNKVQLDILPRFVKSDEGRVALDLFLEKVGLGNNLDFERTVAQYKWKPTKMGAEIIFDQYLSDKAAFSANISAENRDAILKRLDNWPPRDLFDGLEVDKNLKFKEAVTQYQSRPDVAAAQQIFNHYLSDEADSPMNISAESRAAILAILKKLDSGPPRDLFDTAEADESPQIARAIGNFNATAAATPPGLGLHDPGRDFSAAAGAGDGAVGPAADRASDINTESGSGADKGLNLDGLDGLAAAGAAAGGGKSISGPSAPPARPPGSQTQPAPQADLDSDRKPEKEKTGKEHAE